jgi:hypothetical protein
LNAGTGLNHDQSGSSRRCVDQLQTCRWIHHTNCRGQGVRVNPVGSHDSNAPPTHERFAGSRIDDVGIANAGYFDKLLGISRG